MSERLYSRPCSVCGCGLNITLDTMTEDITITAQNLDPLAKDVLEVVSAYKGLKGLGASWERQHRARAIVNAQQLIKAAGPLGGAQERCLGLLAWLKESGKEFDLSSASSYFMAYSSHLAAKEMRSRCRHCGISFSGTGPSCPNHKWMDEGEL